VEWWTLSRFDARHCLPPFLFLCKRIGVSPSFTLERATAFHPVAATLGCWSSPLHFPWLTCR